MGYRTRLSHEYSDWLTKPQMLAPCLTVTEVYTIKRPLLFLDTPTQHFSFKWHSLSYKTWPSDELMVILLPHSLSSGITVGPTLDF